jgi:hypothetical protein
VKPGQVRERSGSTVPEIVQITEEPTRAQAARAAGVLAGIAVGLGREGELPAALEVFGLSGVPRDRATRAALTADLDEEVRRRLRMRRGDM